MQQADGQNVPLAKLKSTSTELISRASTKPKQTRRVSLYLQGATSGHVHSSREPSNSVAKLTDGGETRPHELVEITVDPATVRGQLLKKSEPAEVEQG